VQEEKYKCLLISDFTIDNLAGLLNNDDEDPRLEAFTAPFAQAMPILLDGNHECWKKGYDVAVVWTRPQSVSEAFNALLSYNKVDIEEIFGQIDNYCSTLSNLSQRVRFTFVPSWVLPLYHRGFGMLELQPLVGLTNILMQINLRLFENVANLSNIYALDTQRWVTLAGKKAFNPKLWYMGKIGFGNEVFIEAIKDIKASIRGLTGQAKKLIIVDLDDTLWGGIVGDDGWENLKLGGHDYIGEAYVDFQQALKSLTNRGILLGIVSKNEEQVALEAIERHPEMVLKRDDFAGWKINWNDKAQNIVELINELNLGLQSVVFLDDNPVERARVRESLPEILVPELPQDKMLYASTLLSLRCFDTPLLTREDLVRTQLYVSDRKRKDLQKTITSIDQWLKTLDIKVKIESLKASNLERVTQLLNKTNQMNLTTRRMTEAELTEWEKHDHHKLWTFRVSDKYGDSGLTGIVSVEIKDKKGRIVDFVLSCRVMGRKIEEVMVYRVYEYAKSVGLHELYANYLPTKKNKPCFDFWLRSGFTYDEEKNLFSWDMKNNYPQPDCVQIELIDSFF
jgi:FkbH-like protein